MRQFLRLLIVVLLFGMASHAYADAISNIQFSPGSGCALVFGQYVNITYNYSITTAGGVRIFPRLITNGAPTPNYGASGSGLYSGNGTESANFTITSGNATVDHVRFQVYNADQSQLILEFYVPVFFIFASSGIYNIQLTPVTPASVKNNNHVDIAFNYSTTQAGGVRVYCEPMLGASFAPNGAYQPSPLYSTGSGSGSSYVTVLSGATWMDGIRFSMWKGDNSAELLRFTLPVRYYFTGTSIQNVAYTPSSPSGLVFGQNVDASFTYSTDEATGVRIFVRPYTRGSFTANYGAHASPTYPKGTGDGTGWFTISSQEVTVDSLVFLVYDGATGTNLLLTHFVPVNLHYAAHKVTNIVFNPTSPAYFTTSHNDNVQFGYSHSYTAGVLLWTIPCTGGNWTEGCSFAGSGVIAAGTGTASRSFSVASGNHVVDCARFLMRNQSQSETVLNWDVPVRFYFGNQLLVGVHELPEQPKSFALEQNFPNPFNPTTTIRYVIADQRLVTIRVHDVLGRVVATLVNEVKQGGEYSVQFDASGLASGVYFYRLQAGDYALTKRLVLVK